MTIGQGPQRIDGAWWDHSGDKWRRWNEDTASWDEQQQGPASTTTATYASTHGPPEKAAGPTGEATDPAETWAAVRVDRLPAREPTMETRTTPTSGGVGAARWLVAVGLVALLVAAGFGAHAVFFKTHPPTQEEIDAAFGTLSGYSYQDVAPEVIDLAREAIAEDPDTKDLVADLDGRQVMRDSVPVGAVIVMGFDPANADQLDDQTLPTGIELGPGISVERVTRSGAEMYEMELPGGAVEVFLDAEDGMIFTVAMRDLASAQDISSQLAETNLP